MFALNLEAYAFGEEGCRAGAHTSRSGLGDMAVSGGGSGRHLRLRLAGARHGAAGDVTLIDLDTEAFTPLKDAQRQLLYAGTGSSVRNVVVDGRIVVKDSRLTLVDEKALRAEARPGGDLSPDIWQRFRLSHEPSPDATRG